VLHALVDLPLRGIPGGGRAVSAHAVVGRARLVRRPWPGTVIHIIFSLPGMVIATIFVTLPFVVREVEPVLVEIGQEQETGRRPPLGRRAGRSFGASRLPAIRWGLAYGVVLTVARSLGEFGALTVVAGWCGRAVPDPHPAGARPVSGRPQYLRRLLRGHRADGARPLLTLLLMVSGEPPARHANRGGGPRDLGPTVVRQALRVRRRSWTTFPWTSRTAR